MKYKNILYLLAIFNNYYFTSYSYLNIFLISYILIYNTYSFLILIIIIRYTLNLIININLYPIYIIKLIYFLYILIFVLLFNHINKYLFM